MFKVIKSNRPNIRTEIYGRSLDLCSEKKTPENAVIALCWEIGLAESNDKLFQEP